MYECLCLETRPSFLCGYASRRVRLSARCRHQSNEQHSVIKVTMYACPFALYGEAPRSSGGCRWVLAQNSFGGHHLASGVWDKWINIIASKPLGFFPNGINVALCSVKTAPFIATEQAGPRHVPVASCLRQGAARVPAECGELVPACAMTSSLDEVFLCTFAGPTTSLNSIAVKLG